MLIINGTIGELISVSLQTESIYKKQILCFDSTSVALFICSLLPQELPKDILTFLLEEARL